MRHAGLVGRAQGAPAIGWARDRGTRREGDQRENECSYHGQERAGHDISEYDNEAIHVTFFGRSVQGRLASLDMKVAMG